jgi:DNA (cytosine-5)-methyltransferase 1
LSAKRPPLLLDLYCGEGGASAGYADAGFEVVGVDREPKPRYPFEFVQGDAIDVMIELLAGGKIAGRTLRSFKAITASPPCEAYSSITPEGARARHPKLIAPTRILLERAGKPYVIENVERARRELISPMMLCGSSFGLEVRRHRLFESNVFLMSRPCDHGNQRQIYGVYGDHANESHLYRHKDGTKRGARARTTEHAQELMGMPWASWQGLRKAIPPAYTEFIGEQLRAVIA